MWFALLYTHIILIFQKRQVALFIPIVHLKKTPNLAYLSSDSYRETADKRVQTDILVVSWPFRNGLVSLLQLG